MIIMVVPQGQMAVDDEEWSTIREAMEGDPGEVVRLKGHDGLPVMIRAGDIEIAYRQSDISPAQQEQRRGIRGPDGQPH